VGLVGKDGGALWGLSMALHEWTEFVEGQVKDTNLDTYSLLRIGDVPEMDISFVDSVETPVGLGEPPTTSSLPPLAMQSSPRWGPGFATCPSARPLCSKHSRARIESNDSGASAIRTRLGRELIDRPPASACWTLVGAPLQPRA
jgi:hypothetical protein